MRIAFVNILMCIVVIRKVIMYRNGVDTEEEIYKVTYFGKGRMPVS